MTFNIFLEHVYEQSIVKPSADAFIFQDLIREGSG